MNRLLVIRRGGLGDTLLLAPLLRALRRVHDGAALHVAGTREFCDVLCGYGTVDVAHSAEDFELWDVRRATARLASFDLVIGDEPDVVHRALSPASVQPGVPFGLQLARQVGLEPRWPDDAWLGRPAAARAALDGGDVVLAPGSGGRAKCWPREHWLALAARLAGRVATLRVVVGPVELERDDPREWPWPRPAAAELSFVVEREPFRLARTIEGADRFVGNDSGTTHLAAMLGVPTVAVFLASDPDVWAPVGPHVRVVGGPSQLPTVAEVAAAVG